MNFPAQDKLTGLVKDDTTQTNSLTTNDEDLFAFTRGPHDADVIFVGEAWGADEARAKKPFVGSSGKELDRILFDAGLSTAKILFTNVVNAQPRGNEFTDFLVPTKQAKSSLEAVLINGVYCRYIVDEHLTKLEKLIDRVKPKLIIGAGNWPLWALTTNRATITTKQGTRVAGGITKWRGSQLYTRPISNATYPFLPITHPAAILRAWYLRFPTVHDLKCRAGRYLSGSRPLWGDPDPDGLHNPTFQEAIDWLRAVAYDLKNHKPVELSVDIETKWKKHISCCGLATKTSAICIPFFYFDKEGKVVDYFTLEEEQAIWHELKAILSSPQAKIIGQNFAYDTMYFKVMHGITANVSFDTMLAHHLLWPGTPKGLDYLSSLYCDSHVYWKDESEEWDDGISHENLWKYNLKDIRKTFEIKEELSGLLRKFNFEEQYACQIEQWYFTRAMGLRGVRQDLDLRKRMRQDLVKQQSHLASILLRCVPADCRYLPTGKPWFTSPVASQDLIYRQLGITPVLHKKTKKPTLDASSFEPIRKQAPWLKPIIDALDKIRSINVFITHFLDAKLSFDGRMKCSFNVGGTETFRLSSNSNPFDEGGNLQNIPKGDSE